MRSTSKRSFDSSQERIEQLEHKLESARWTIIQLVPIEYQDTLKSFEECKSTRDFWRWRDLAAAKIANLVPESATSETFGTRRADCPLCGRSTMGPYPDGFTIPVGLIRHFTGFGNAHQCVVTEAAFALGKDYVEREFGKAERIAEEAEEAQKVHAVAARRATERLYKIHPFGAPELIDESTGSWFGRHRTADKLEWAEARVIALGFTRNQDGNVLTLTLERDGHIIFADIRNENKIRFNIFKNPLKKSKTLKKGGFDFLDNIKHDLRAKFDERLTTAILLF